MRTWKAAVVSSVLIVFMLVVPCAAEEDESYPPLPEALAAMESDAAVTVTRGEFPRETENPYYYIFEPLAAQPSTGFMIYPGGKVDPRSYAPTARAIAEAGYLVVIVGMPQDLAHLGWKRGSTVLRNFDYIETWAIGGHSMGGSFSCLFARRHPFKIDGVVLWASWPSVLFRLDRRNIKAISIYGSNDGYPDYIEDGALHLPPGTEFVKIEGGNHTQFGYYDTSPLEYQPNDNAADISREQQQEQIVQATVDFLDSL